MNWGDDDIEVAQDVTAQNWLSGGVGNDRLHAGGGSSILLGGEGDDLLIGGAGRDVLIGGIGSDDLRGRSGEGVTDAPLTHNSRCDWHLRRIAVTSQ